MMLILQKNIYMEQKLLYPNLKNLLHYSIKGSFILFVH